MLKDKKKPVTPNSKRLKNLPAAHFSNQSSEWHPKVFVKTFGCQMNARDTEMIYGMLLRRGYGIAGDMAEADVVLFNTCSVRKHAEERVWGQVGMLKKLEAQSLNLPAPARPAGGGKAGLKVIGLVGCMAQNYKEEIFKRLPHINLVCGTGNIYEIGDFVDRLIERESDRILAVDREQRPQSLNGSCAAYRQGTMKAYVSIMEGCDNFCSYCIVPYVRGRERCRERDGILAEVKMLAGRGFKEVTLLGQNVNSYSDSKADFVELLREINETGVARVRFMTSHPKDVSEDLFKAIRDLPHLCEHLHLPLQSGSDKILKLMNRGYRISDYISLVENFRKILPRASITTDIIVGFPAETKEDFAQTRQVLAEIRFDSAFVFKYSPRPPAAASKLKDDVSQDEKRQRNRMLLELQDEISRGKNQCLAGRVEEILVEGNSKKTNAQLFGRTGTNKITVFDGKNALIGKLVRVKIEKATPHTLIGVIDAKN